MLGSVSNLPVGAPRSLFLAASSNFRSISGDRSLSLSQHSQLDTLHQSFISNISQTGLHLSSFQATFNSQMSKAGFVLQSHCLYGII